MILSNFSAKQILPRAVAHFGKPPVSSSRFSVSAVIFSKVTTQNPPFLFPFRCLRTDQANFFFLMPPN